MPGLDHEENAREIAIYEDRCTQSDPGELPHGQTTSLSEYALATKRSRLLFIGFIFPSSAFITEFDFLHPGDILLEYAFIVRGKYLGLS